jgi:hypothetical protein
MAGIGAEIIGGDLLGGAGADILGGAGRDLLGGGGDILGGGVRGLIPDIETGSTASRGLLGEGGAGLRNAEPEIGNAGPRVGNAEPRVGNGEVRAGNGEARAEDGEPRAENREPRAENRPAGEGQQPLGRRLLNAGQRIGSRLLQAANDYFIITTVLQVLQGRSQQNPTPDNQQVTALWTAIAAGAKAYEDAAQAWQTWLQENQTNAASFGTTPSGFGTEQTYVALQDTLDALTEDWEKNVLPLIKTANTNSATITATDLEPLKVAMTKDLTTALTIAKSIDSNSQLVAGGLQSYTTELQSAISGFPSS